MKKTVTSSITVNFTVEMDTERMTEYGVHAHIREKLEEALRSSLFKFELIDGIEPLRNRVIQEAYTEAIAATKGNSAPAVPRIVFDHVLNAWNQGWRTVYNANTDWDFVSRYKHLQEPDNSIYGRTITLPTLTRQELVEMWREYTSTISDKFQDTILVELRRMVCETFDGQVEDGLREATPTKKVTK
jgi:hypothetical protein